MAAVTSCESTGVMEMGWGGEGDHAELDFSLSLIFRKQYSAIIR